ncbi:MAG: protein-disulfide reductase DsbD [Burkholderiaceae bacterium]
MLDGIAGLASRRFFVAFSVFLMALTALFRASDARAQENFLDPNAAFVLSAAMASPTELDVHFKIAPGYYMYRERFNFALTPDANYLGKPILPAGIVKYDQTFEKEVETYHNQVTVRVPLVAGASRPLKLAVTSQGCADAGICYPPMTSNLQLNPVVTGYQAVGPRVVASVPGPAPQTIASDGVAPSGGSSGLSAALGFNDAHFASYLADAGWLQIVALCLAFGVLLSFTPCVLPMVPILLTIIAGGGGKAKKVSHWRGLSLAAIYVLGMSVVYTALGVVAGVVGAGLAAWLQTPWVLALFAALLGLLALSMFDVFTLQTPIRLQTALSDKVSRIPGGHYSGALVMGMLSALIVGPCVAAPLAGVLLFISQSGNIVLGGAALFALAWGEGLLLLALGASSGALLPKAGPWMEDIKRFFGILLAATAWWMVGPIIPAWTAIAGWAFLALWAAVMLRAFEALPDPAGLQRFLGKTLGLLLALWALVLFVGLAAGGRDILQPLAPFAGSGGASAAFGGPVAAGAKANIPLFVNVGSVAELDTLLANTSRPVMLDFYADWCVSCIEMEKFTFTDANVAQKMSAMLLLRADVTKNGPDDRALLKRFRLFGPPGTIFFDAHGRELTDARVVGFTKARPFAAVLDRVLQTASK